MAIAPKSQSPLKTELDIFNEYSTKAAAEDEKLTEDLANYDANIEQATEPVDTKIEEYNKSKPLKELMFGIEEAGANINKAISGLGTGFADTRNAIGMSDAALQDVQGRRAKFSDELTKLKADREAAAKKYEAGRGRITEDYKLQQGLRNQAYDRQMKGVELTEAYGQVSKPMELVIQKLANRTGVKLNEVNINNKTAPDLLRGLQSLYELQEKAQTKPESVTTKEELDNLNKSLESVGAQKLPDSYIGKPPAAVTTAFNAVVNVEKERRYEFNDRGRPAPIEQKDGVEYLDLAKLTDRQSMGKNQSKEFSDILSKSRSEAIKGIDSIEALNQLSKLSDIDGNWVANSALTGQLPRVLGGEKGVLTEPDIQRYSGTPSLQATLRRYKDKITNGEVFTKEDIQDIRSLLPMLIEDKKRFIQEKQNAFSANINAILQTNTLPSSVQRKITDAVLNSKNGGKILLKSLNVPDADREAIKAQFAKDGKPEPTEEIIEKIYNQKLTASKNSSTKPTTPVDPGLDAFLKKQGK